MTKNQPIHELRLGAVKAAVWENKAGDSTILNVTFGRLYRDGENWRTSDSFGRDDLLLLAKVADQAHSWIHEQRATRPAAAAPPDNSAPRRTR